MQTFLPSPSFTASARFLDNQRLGKQRVEAKQILIALDVSVGEHRGNTASRWRNHPAVKMWRGFEPALARYAATVCQVWRQRGFRDTLLEQFESICGDEPCLAPPWLGFDAVHSSHRSNLLRKFPEWYGRFGWSESQDLPYVWPEGSER